MVERSLCMDQVGGSTPSCGPMTRRITLTNAPARLPAPGAALRAPEKVAAPLYLSREWRALVSLVRQQRGYRCEACGADMSANRRALHADHITEVSDGGAPLDVLNVRLLCQGCHNAKTATARRARHQAG